MLIGLVGLIMPIMPGWIFIIPGLVILADHSPAIRRLLEWAKGKFEDARTAAGGKPSATMENRSDSGK
ncbi:MAG TPA: PGPGW domain-containing protein [Bryobacteraceae bacterium]|nr:PGPGW domain-containing protein [Bryobacteraceae bacterium]